MDGPCPAVNPLKKVPALIDAHGSSLFEASVILNYLEDKFTGQGSGGGGVAAAVGLLLRIERMHVLTRCA